MSLKRKEPPHSWEGGEIKAEMQGCLNGDIYRRSHGRQKRMRYAPQYYALDIVLGCGLVIAGWPQDIPFTDLSAVGGGIDTLREIRRRWYLPDGDPEKLRFEPASREDYANAAHDPESVHPTPQHLPELKARAAAAKARAQALPVESDVYDSRNMRRVGRQSTSTMPEPKAWTQQRQDTKKRRARASDMETRVRKKRQTTGVTSMPFVLQGADKVSGGDGEQGSDSEEAYTLDDPITDFNLTRSFGGELSDDPIKDASDSKREKA
ncbi:uncharacterized protein TRAVEDRAFT_54233 [Trametes versicolor FP-101664 SS1]|uniref:Uncharacterized protein n=1 Tax=Trametes versicolor (strain FP-101664) TaxID=717944 RepID=R7S726_TRAVS|nr:uncharacterized protein TRAVEDRAFT_54233 [Trametes versicolor FP-101664 SS1]EIW51808.1 hypothetical protein TRAVEDRAFT_54233 [Trametes versicolor FP-101664 SS1]